MSDPFNAPPGSTEPKRNRFEGINFRVIDPKEEKDAEGRSFIGRPMTEFFDYIKEIYGQRYYIPGPEYEEYLLSLPTEQVPAQFKNDNFYKFIGSIVDGKVPGVMCDTGGQFGAKMKLFARRVALDGDLDSRDRVVLLEK